MSTDVTDHGLNEETAKDETAGPIHATYTGERASSSKMIEGWRSKCAMRNRQRDAN